MKKAWYYPDNRVDWAAVWKTPLYFLGELGNAKEFSESKFDGPSQATRDDIIRQVRKVSQHTDNPDMTQAGKHRLKRWY